MAASSTPDINVIAALGLSDASFEAFPTGLINDSWLVVMPGGERRVLQRVNPIFPTAINDDIEVVTRHLQSSGMLTPRLIPMADGALVIKVDGYNWRQLTYISGRTYDSIENTHQADEAGALLGRFHAAVDGLDYSFANARLQVHDTVMHLANLSSALETHDNHAEISRVQALADEVFELANQLPELGDQLNRIVHGDPKISNVVFSSNTTKAKCLIDLDTLGYMPIALELGDAFRSWCNPLAEDAPGAEFSLLIFHSAIGGYARDSRSLLAENEWRKIPAATFTITVELAARFCADALNESYFRWDPLHFHSPSHHNQLRARSQINLAHSISGQREQIETEVLAAFK
jgi:Ser/Thr protein kinase RdoA (MazF antagonist)